MAWNAHIGLDWMLMFVCACDSYVGFSSGTSRKSVVNPYHVSYAPVSAQDSELQSLSSDAPTDDTTTSHTTDSSSAFVYCVIYTPSFVFNIIRQSIFLLSVPLGTVS